MSDTAILTFPLLAGALVRGKARKAIEAYCQREGLKCEVFEQKSWFESMYYFRITGDIDKCQQLRERIREVPA